MTLSNQACEELTAFLVKLAEFLPAPVRRMVGVSESLILAKILQDREHLEKKVLEPFHGWLHEHHVGVYVLLASKEEKGDAQV